MSSKVQEHHIDSEARECFGLVLTFSRDFSMNKLNSCGLVRSPWHTPRE